MTQTHLPSAAQKHPLQACRQRAAPGQAFPVTGVVYSSKDCTLLITETHHKASSVVRGILLADNALVSSVAL